MTLFSILHQKIRVPTEKPSADDADRHVDEIPHIELEFSHNPADVTEHRLHIKAPDGRTIELTFAKNGQHVSTELYRADERPVPFEKTHETEAREQREKRAAEANAPKQSAPPLPAKGDKPVSASEGRRQATQRNAEGGEPPTDKPVGEDRNTVERSGA